MNKNDDDDSSGSSYSYDEGKMARAMVIPNVKKENNTKNKNIHPEYKNILFLRLVSIAPPTLSNQIHPTILLRHPDQAGGIHHTKLTSCTTPRNISFIFLCAQCNSYSEYSRWHQHTIPMKELKKKRLCISAIKKMKNCRNSCNRYCRNVNEKKIGKNIYRTSTKHAEHPI